MKPTEMHKLAHAGCHQAAPKAWRDVPNVTGDFDLDATIRHCSNRDMPARLAQHVRRSGPLTGYTGYRGYQGDN